MERIEGFTLIELLVVVLIIGILAAVALPQYQRAVFKSRMTQAQVIQNAVHQARVLYKLESGEEAVKFDQLTLSLPSGCVPGRLGNLGEDSLFCKGFGFYIATYTSLATIEEGVGAPFHFDKLYPSGEFSCRTYGNKVAEDYCRGMGYPYRD